MLRNLPEGSRYIAAMSADRDDDGPEDTERDPRQEAVMDHRVWTIDRRLKAMEINTLYSLIAVTGEWGPKGPPNFPTIGPASWQPTSTPKSSEPKDNYDVLKRMGWPGG